MTVELIKCEGQDGACPNPPKWKCNECGCTACDDCIDAAGKACPGCQEAV